MLLLSFGLGLLGFVEPCSIGSTLLFIKYLEGKSKRCKVAQVSVFAITRGVFIGLLGVAATVLGSIFLAFQQMAWIVLGAGYVSLGILYLIGRARFLIISLGNNFALLSGLRGSATLGVVFGLNIPACATPLLIALFVTAAASGASGGTLASGFVSLAVFGLTLSLPLVTAVLFEPARRILDWLANLSGRLPIWTGLLLIALGLWSVWFALFAKIAG